MRNYEEDYNMVVDVHYDRRKHIRVKCTNRDCLLMANCHSDHERSEGEESIRDSSPIGLRMTKSEGLRMTKNIGLRMTKSEGLRMTRWGVAKQSLYNLVEI